MKKDHWKIIYFGFGMVALLAFLFFGTACQEVSNPLGPEPEITSTNNTTQTSSQTSSTSTQTQDEIVQVKKPTSTPTPLTQFDQATDGTKVNKASGNNLSENQTFQSKTNRTIKGTIKGAISPETHPPIELGSTSIRPLRKPLNEKKTPKTFFNPNSSTPSTSNSDGDSDGDGDDDQNKRPCQELHIQVSPDTWNLNWVNSSGLVTVRFIGEGATTIDPESITLSLASEDASYTSETISPAWTKINDSHLIAKFRKNEVIQLLPEEAKAGDIFQVLINGEFLSGNGDSSNGDNTGGDGVAFTEPLTDTIRVVGQRQEDEEDEDEYLTIKLTPKNWNPAWAFQTTDSNDEEDGDDGYVVAHFKGEGIGDIVEGSISLSLGPCGSTTGEPITPVEEGLSEDGDEYHAYFEKSAAIGLIENPQPGDTYKVSVQVTAGDESYCEIFTIKIVGQSHELTVKIKPDKWNISWWNKENNNDETIQVIFKGIGYDQINSDTIQIVYGGSTIGSSAIVDSELDEDDHKLIVYFERSEVITLISDPKVGDSHDLTVSWSDLAGDPSSAEVTISITGKKK